MFLLCSITLEYAGSSTSWTDGVWAFLEVPTECLNFNLKIPRCHIPEACTQVRQFVVMFLCFLVFLYSSNTDCNTLQLQTIWENDRHALESRFLWLSYSYTAPSLHFSLFYFIRVIFCAVIIYSPLCTRVKESFDQLFNMRKRRIQYIRARYAGMPCLLLLYVCHMLIILTERLHCCTHAGWREPWQYEGKLRVPEEPHSAGCDPPESHQPYLQQQTQCLYSTSKGLYST